MIFGGGVSLAVGKRLSPQRQAMLALELTQMAQRIPEVDEAINDPDRPAEAIPAAACNRYLEAALDFGNPSKPLRDALEKLLMRRAASEKPAPPRPVVRKPKKPPTPTRRLRVYALDPSMTQRLDFVAVNRTTLCVPWDDQPETKEPLRPGPIGEYLEVVDVDPASDRVYDPVDLNNPTLLAQDGWAPSEGNPEFHQQMVYAVGMTTIGHFEKALGRKALWAPRYATRDEGGWRDASEVPRLRIYPHALRTDNAYYSPEKKALLFGYFPADSSAKDATVPGSMVFSCLSSDIIAHEMSHALLDGLHRRFQEASNPPAELSRRFHGSVPPQGDLADGRAHRLRGDVGLEFTRLSQPGLGPQYSQRPRFRLESRPLPVGDVCAQRRESMDTAERAEEGIR
jgi:hypothetical protein